MTLIKVRRINRTSKDNEIDKVIANGKNNGGDEDCVAESFLAFLDD